MRTTAWLAPMLASKTTAASNPVMNFIDQPQFKPAGPESGLGDALY
jgi:hypothetical protein